MIELISLLFFSNNKPIGLKSAGINTSELKNSHKKDLSEFFSPNFQNLKIFQNNNTPQMCNITDLIPHHQ